MSAVAADEMLARFLLSSRQFSREARRAKADAFIPHPHAELSVFRTHDLKDEAIWSLGLTVAEPSGKTLHGRAELICETVRALGFEAVPDEPPPRHANITGWPRNDKGAQRLRALELAALAKLVLPA